MDRIKFYRIFSFWGWLVFFLSFILSTSLLIYYFTGMQSSFIYKGIKSLNREDFTQAQKYFRQALDKKPYDPWPHMNLALTYDLSDAPDKAFKNYNIVSSHLKEQSNLANFFSYFNQAELNGRLGQLKEALANYQKALGFRYKEKEIKKNIELLFRDNQKNDKTDQKNEDKKDSEANKNKKNNEQSQKEDGSNDKQNDEQDQGEDGDNDKQNEQDQGEDGDNDESNNNRNQNGEDNNNKSDSSKNQQGKNNQNGEQKLEFFMSDTEEDAVLEEIEKQENKVREQFFRRKNIFGDKTKKDW